MCKLRNLSWAVVLAISVFSIPAHAKTLSCFWDLNATIGITSVGKDDNLPVNGPVGNCVESNGDTWTLIYVGRGVGLHFSANRFLVSCPFVKNLEGDYHGTKVGFGGAVDGFTGIFAGKNGVCLINGIGVGAGGTATIGRLSIYSNKQ